MKTLRYTKRLQVLLLLTCLFLVPLLFSGMTINTILVKGLVMKTLLACLLACAVVYNGLLGRIRPLSSPLLIPSTIYIGWMFLVALPGGLHPNESDFIIQSLLLLFLAYFISVRGREMRLHLRIISMLLIVACITSLYAVVQILELDFFQWWRFDWTLPIRRVCASFGNPNFFAGFLVPVIPLTFAVQKVCTFPRIRRLMWGLLFLELVALILTFSKGGLLGLIVAMAFYFAVLVFSKTQKLIKPLVLILLSLSIASWFLWSPEHGTAAGEDKIVEVVMLSTGARTEIYRSTMDMIRDNPLMGVGPGLYVKYLPEYRTPELTLFHPPQMFLINHAHSEYLEQAAELGIPGLLLFLWIVFVALRSALSSTGKTELEKTLSLGIAAGLVGILVQNVFSVNLRKTPSMLNFWTFIGLAVCLRTPMTERTAIKIRPMLRIIASLLAAWIALSIPLTQSKKLIVDLLLREGGRHLKQGSANAGGRALSKAIRLQPGRVEGYYWLGSIYFRTGDYSRAIEEFEKVVALQGNFVNTIFNLATSYAKNNEPEKAIQAYKKALQSAPYDPRIHDYLGRTYLRRADSPDHQQLAQDHFRKSSEYYLIHIQRNPTDSGLHLERGKVLILLDDLEGAKQEFQKALEIAPETREAKLFLQRLGE